MCVHSTEGESVGVRLGVLLGNSLEYCYKWVPSDAIMQLQPFFINPIPSPLDTRPILDLKLKLDTLK